MIRVASCNPAECSRAILNTRIQQARIADELGYPEPTDVAIKEFLSQEQCPGATELTLGSTVLARVCYENPLTAVFVTARKR